MLHLIATVSLSTAPPPPQLEARADGVLLTFTQAVPDEWLKADRWTVKGEAPGRIERSPDARRVFLHAPMAPGNIKVTRDHSPMGDVAWTTGITRTGPDFAAANTATHPHLLRTPPPDAIVLLDANGPAGLVMKKDPAGPFAWVLKGDELHVKRGTGDMISRVPLGSGRYHVEWCTPAGGDAEAQNNGNSGVKIESRYEVQIMNNAGAPWPSRFNEAGSIYRVKAADHNVALGANRWQVYDIDYTRPVWHDGRKVADARMTVWWNGVKVHDDVLVPNKTGASIEEGPAPMPLLLQDHHHVGKGDVRFRNVWFQPAPKQESAPAGAPGAKQHE